jgi:hypothetical protein
MAKKQQQAQAPKNNKGLHAAVLASLILSTSSLVYSIVDKFIHHDMVCSIKAVDQVTQLVILDCTK